MSGAGGRVGGEDVIGVPVEVLAGPLWRAWWCACRHGGRQRSRPLTGIITNWQVRLSPGELVVPVAGGWPGRRRCLSYGRVRSCLVRGR
jgi:hypothetical protein